MAELITSPNNIKLDTLTQINYVNITNSTKAGDNLFYCNRPETVTTSHIAENGKFLCKGSISGSGRIYTWHHNYVGGSIKHYILVNNPNSYDITLSLSKINKTNVDVNSGLGDVAAWKNYLSGIGSNATISVAAGSTQILSEISPITFNYAFGMLMDVSIKRAGTSTSASAIFIDTVQAASSVITNVTSAATSTEERVRGVSAQNKITLDGGTLVYDGSTKYMAKRVFDNTYGDNSLLTVSHSYGDGGGKIKGNYGTIATINLTLRNESTLSRKLVLRLGSSGGLSKTAIKFGSSTIAQNAEAFYYTSIIKSKLLSPNTSETISLDFAVAAMASAPYMFVIDKE